MHSFFLFFFFFFSTCAHWCIHGAKRVNARERMFEEFRPVLRTHAHSRVFLSEIYTITYSPYVNMLVCGFHVVTFGAPLGYHNTFHLAMALT